MKKPIWLIITHILLSSVCYSQPENHIVIKDTIYVGGEIKFNHDSPYFVRYKKSGSNTFDIYSPKEVTKFVINGSAFYPRLVIERKETNPLIFIEALVPGDIKLLRSPIGIYDYYWEKDTMLPLTIDNYQDVILSIAEQCPRWKQQYKNIKFNKNSLLFIFGNYNMNQCKNIPFLSIGPSVKMNFTDLHVPSDSYRENMFGDYIINSNFLSFGIYGNYRLWKESNMSYVFNLDYSNTVFTKELTSIVYHHDIKFEYSFLHFDFKLNRYFFNSDIIRPYAQLGPALLFANNSKSYLYRLEYDIPLIYGQSVEGFADFPSLYGGFSAGAGLEIFITPRKYLLLEVNTNRLYSNNKFKIANNIISIKLNIWSI